MNINQYKRILERRSEIVKEVASLDVPEDMRRQLLPVKQKWVHDKTGDFFIWFNFPGYGDGWSYRAQIPLKAWREGRPITLVKMSAEHNKKRTKLFYEEA